jgi:signal transduction histidine kinase
VGRLIEQAARARKGAAVGPIPHPGSREMAELSSALADMARSLNERAAYIEAFAQSVSHEFKTPLATVEGAVEVLRDHIGTMTPAERERFLGMLTQESQRMRRLVERLLVLARADTASASREGTEVAPALAATVERFREGGLDVALRADAGLDGCRATVSPEGIEVVLSNLLENAKQHGGPRVRVEVGARREERGPDAPGVRLEVRDDGRGISDGNRSKVFDPFFTTARDAGGTGLGLSIVRALVESQGGVVEVADGSERGASFVVWLPALEAGPETGASAGGGPPSGPKA